MQTVLSTTDLGQIEINNIHPIFPKLRSASTLSYCLDIV